METARIFAMALPLAAGCAAASKGDGSRAKSACARVVAHGTAAGIDSFGASAPAYALFPHFGITVERLIEVSNAL